MLLLLFVLLLNIWMDLSLEVFICIFTIQVSDISGDFTVRKTIISLSVRLESVLMVIDNLGWMFRKLYYWYHSLVIKNDENFLVENMNKNMTNQPTWCFKTPLFFSAS